MQTAASPHRLRLSVFVLGLGLLIAVSFMLPYPQVPFGGDRYMQWLFAATLVLGVAAIIRRERGAAAIVAIAVTVLAGGLLLLTVLVPLAYGVASKFLMPD